MAIGNQETLEPMSEPNAILSEQAVLGVLLTRPEMIDAVSPALRLDDFYAEQHKIIYRVLLDMAAHGDYIDIIGVQDRLIQTRCLDAAGGPSYLGDLAVIAPTGTNVQKHVDVIRKRSTHRNLIKTADTIKRTAASTTGDLERDINLGIEEMFRLMREGGAIREPLQIGSILPSIIDEIDNRQNGVINSISTGFDDVDLKLNGGLRRGDLVVIAGRPSMGKTTLGMQFGLNAAIDGYKVAVFSLEMSMAQLGERALAQIGGIDYNRIIKGNLLEDDYVRLAVALGKIHEIPLVIDDTGGLTVQDISARARALSKTQGLDVIVVDYLQIMGYAGRALTRNEQIGEMSRQMKALAKELNVVFVLLSQLNRDVEKRLDKRPIMADLRESGAIEQDADVVLMVYRDEFYHPDSEFKGTAEILVRKHRNGETGTVCLAFESDRVRFVNHSSSAFSGRD